MFFLNRLKSEYSRDADGRMPNEKFAAECNRLVSGFAAYGRQNCTHWHTAVVRAGSN